jgi:nucleotide-binding universal stress UspA family protein
MNLEVVMGTRNVVVGVDGSDSALEATRWAAREAVRRRATLRLLAATDWPRGGYVGEVGAGYHAAFVEIARDNAEAAAAAAREAAPGVETEHQVVIGFPVPVLRSESRRAELIALGDRGLGGVAGLLVGSVAVGLTSSAACPVVVVRGAAVPDADPRPVVVGVDGSPLSEAALGFAFEAAAARRVGLVAVHTWSDLIVDPAAVPLGWAAVDWAAVEADEREVLGERLAGWCTTYPDVPVERVVRRDRPAPALLEQAAAAQLVVVGSRGRGSVAGLLLGSVGHALLHRAPCPVAIVRSS